MYRCWVEGTVKCEDNTLLINNVEIGLPFGFPVNALEEYIF